MLPTLDFIHAHIGGVGAVRQRADTHLHMHAERVEDHSLCKIEKVMHLLPFQPILECLLCFRACVRKRV